MRLCQKLVEVADSLLIPPILKIQIPFNHGNAFKQSHHY
jgi:hypothetical protein